MSTSPSRKERNLCSSCNNAPRPGKTQCQDCADRAKQRNAKRIEDGYCIQPSCRNIPAPGKARCDSCAQRRAKYDKKKRQERLLAGVCAECGKPHDEDTKLCAKCKKSRLEAVRRYSYGGHRDTVIERDRGICQVCGNKGKHIHHIDNTGRDGRYNGEKGRPPVNNNLDNLILLCPRCHADIHRLGNKDTRYIASKLLSHASNPDCVIVREKGLMRGWVPIRAQVIRRDACACILCYEERPSLLVVHHKDDAGLRSRKPNNGPDNLVTLCRGCHGAVTNLRNNGNEKAISLILALGPGTTGLPIRSK